MARRIALKTSPAIPFRTTQHEKLRVGALMAPLRSILDLISAHAFSKFSKFVTMKLRKKLTMPNTNCGQQAKVLKFLRETHNHGPLGSVFYD